jgi:hypothetical protein
MLTNLLTSRRYAIPSYFLHSLADQVRSCDHCSDLRLSHCQSVSTGVAWGTGTRNPGYSSCTYGDPRSTTSVDLTTAEFPVILLLANLAQLSFGSAFVRFLPDTGPLT